MAVNCIQRLRKVGGVNAFIITDCHHIDTVVVFLLKYDFSSSFGA